MKGLRSFSSKFSVRGRTGGPCTRIMKTGQVYVNMKSLGLVLLLLFYYKDIPFLLICERRNDLFSLNVYFCVFKPPPSVSPPRASSCVFFVFLFFVLYSSNECLFNDYSDKEGVDR